MTRNLSERATREVAAMSESQVRHAERAADYLARRGETRDAAYGVEVVRVINARRDSEKARRA